VTEATQTHGAERGGQQRLRVKVGLAFVQVLRPALYLLLGASAVLAFWAGGEQRGQHMPGWAESIAPGLFGLFLAIYVVYRLALVRAGRYPGLPALFQIGLGALVFILLLPGTRQQLSGDIPPAAQSRLSGPVDLAELLRASDARVRAVAAELAGLRPRGERWAPQLLERLADDEAEVRSAARAALVRIAGSDATAGLTDADAQVRWRAEAVARGWVPGK
jgi:hypothetical protein